MFEMIMFIMLFALCLLAAGIMGGLLILNLSEEQRIRNKCKQEKAYEKNFLATKKNVSMNRVSSGSFLFTRNNHVP